MARRVVGPHNKRNTAPKRRAGEDTGPYNTIAPLAQGRCPHWPAPVSLPLGEGAPGRTLGRTRGDAGSRMTFPLPGGRWHLRSK